VMLNKDGEVKIMDFGIAETVRTSMSRIQNSSSSGTLVYMSPEQIKGKDVGKESDIYSFGAMLYELLSGNPPFYKGAIEHQILSEKPDSLKKVSDKMDELIMKCLEKDYKDRFNGFGEILTILGEKDVKYKRINTKKNQLQNHPLNRYLNAFLWLILGAVIMSVSKEIVWGAVITIFVGGYFLYNKWREIKTFELIIYWIGITILVTIIIAIVFEFDEESVVMLGPFLLLIFGSCFMISLYKKNIINSFFKFWIYQNLLIILCFFYFIMILLTISDLTFLVLIIKFVLIFIYINSAICWILSKKKGKRKVPIIVSIGIISIIIVSIIGYIIR